MTPSTSYPIGFCRNGHLWKDSFYMKKNGKFFCQTCCLDRQRERRSLALKFPGRVQPAEVRLMQRIDKTPGHGPNGDCWIYTGETKPAMGGKGYAKISRNGKHVFVHRLAWEMEYGPIPEGKMLLHKCDNPPCCRPDHLIPGTQLDNMRDMIAKGRGPNMKQVSLFRHNPQGERNGMAKFKEDQVREIRSEYASGLFSMPHLARKYDTNSGNICLIVNRKTWRHVE
jgi:hypothetical protein